MDLTAIQWAVLMVVLLVISVLIIRPALKRKNELDDYEFSIRNPAGLLTFNTRKDSLIHEGRVNRAKLRLECGVLLFVCSGIALVLLLVYIHYSS